MDAFRESIAAFLKNLITPSFWQGLFAGHAALPALLLYAGRIGASSTAVKRSSTPPTEMQSPLSTGAQPMCRSPLMSTP